MSTRCYIGAIDNTDYTSAVREREREKEKEREGERELLGWCNSKKFRLVTLHE